MSVNDGAAQFGGTTKQIAKLFTLIRGGAFADRDDPSGDLAWFLLNKASTPGARFSPVLKNDLGGAFTYVLNKLGGNPSANWVASEGALIRTQKADGTPKLYVVAWQNMELHKKADGTVEVVNKGTHQLYSQPDVAEVVKMAIGAYQA